MRPSSSQKCFAASAHSGLWKACLAFTGRQATTLAASVRWAAPSSAVAPESTVW